MSADEPQDERLLYRVRIAASVATVALFAFVVIADRDPTTVGMVAGALFVLLGLVSADYVRRSGNGRG